MKDCNEDCKFLDEVWRKVRIKQYERIEMEKVQENKRNLRKMEIKSMLLIFGSLIVISLVLLYSFNFDFACMMLVASIFFCGSQIYEHFIFKRIKNKIQYGN